MEYFWALAKAYGLDYYGYEILCMTQCNEIKQDLWFQLGKLMWRKYLSVFNQNINYNNNDIHNPYKAVILQYAEREREMNGLYYFLTPLVNKGEDYCEAYWVVREKLFTEDDIWTSNQGITSKLDEE